MTEAEWLACADPAAMVHFLPIKGRARQLRLFVCAYLRQTVPDLSAENGASVGLAERWADGAATVEEVRAFRRAHPANWTALGQHPSQSARSCANGACASGRSEPRSVFVRLFRDVFGNPFRPITLGPARRTPTVVSLARAAYDERQLPGGELEPQRLAVLADALEEAGTAGELAAHLRSPGPHVRGCWVLDAVLGLG